VARPLRLNQKVQRPRLLSLPLDHLPPARRHLFPLPSLHLWLTLVLLTYSGPRRALAIQAVHVTRRPSPPIGPVTRMILKLDVVYNVLMGFWYVDVAVMFLVVCINLGVGNSLTV